MKRIITTAIIVLALAGIALLTCPDKAAHKEAIMSVVNEKIDESVDQDLGKEDKGAAMLASSLGSGIVGYFIESRLTVKNHFIFSTGEISYFSGESKRVSVGVFGHVFTFSKEDLDKALEGIM